MPKPGETRIGMTLRDAAVGDPQPGSLKLTLQLTTGTQSANVALNYAMGINLTGKTVRAQVRVEPGTTAMTAKFYIKTSMTYYYADGGQVNLDNPQITYTRRSSDSAKGGDKSFKLRVE